MNSKIIKCIAAASLSLFVSGTAVAADTFYDVTVQTGWHKHAGTDASIYIWLYGTKGKSKRYHLNIRNYDDNERGKKTTYRFKSNRDLGRINKVVATNSYDDDDGPGWQLSYMNVGKIGHRAAHFPCNRWLSSDSKTTRILYPGRRCR